MIEGPEKCILILGATTRIFETANYKPAASEGKVYNTYN